MVFSSGGQQQYPSQSMYNESEEDLRDYLQRIESLYEYNSNMLESVRSGAYLCSEYTAIPLEDSMLFIDDDDVFEEDSVLIKRASVVLVSPTVAPSGGTITKQLKAFNRHSLQQTYSKKSRTADPEDKASYHHHHQRRRSRRRRLISRKASLTFYQSCLAYLHILFNALGSIVCMYAAGTDSDMILWIGVAFNALAHLMRAFVHVSRDELREVLKAIDVMEGRETSNEEDMDRSITTTTTTTTTTTATTIAAASTAVSTKKHQPATTMTTDNQDDTTTDDDSDKYTGSTYQRGRLELIKANKRRLSTVARLIRTNDVLTLYKLQLAYLFHACNMGGSFFLTYAMNLDDKDMKWIGICLQAIAQLLHLVERSNAANVQYNQRDMVTIKIQSLQ